jgi:hypothetical protein
MMHDGMMDGMIGVGMLVWTIVGLLLVVLLAVAIIKLLRK